VSQALTKDTTELARRCTLDIGQEVTPQEVRNYLLIGDVALYRFSTEDRQELAVTIVQALG
jgi:hypothetical protein